MAIVDRRGATVNAVDPPAATTPNAGLAIKTAVRVAIGVNIDLQTFGLGTGDGVALAANDRALLFGQTVATENGLYSASTGVWQRTSDFSDNSQVADGLLVYVTEGDANARGLLRLEADNPVLIGTSAIAFNKALLFRETLAADRTLNVPAEYPTIQDALDAAGKLDLNGFDVVIDIADGHYPEALITPAMLTGNRITGGGSVTLLGNTTTPANVEIGGASFSGTPFSCSNIGYFVLDGVRLTSTGARLVDMNSPVSTVQLNAVELNNLGPVQSGRAQFGADLFIQGPVSIVAVPSVPGQALFIAQAKGIITINNAAVSPRGALEFPTALGSGLYVFYSNDDGYVQVDSAATFVNAGNWQGKFAHVTLRGIMQVNPALSVMPGGATFDHDGTGLITTNNLTVASGVYSASAGLLSWNFSNTWTASLDASANTASRTYILPDISSTLAVLGLAQTFTAAQTIQAAAVGALSVGPNGATNPSFRVDTNVAGIETGIVIQPAAPGGGAGVAARSSAANENLRLNAKATGELHLGDTSTGNIVAYRPVILAADPTTALGAATKQYADALVVGLLDDRGNYNASGNVFPSSGGSGSAGAILKGDLWFISVAGTLGGVAVNIGDQLRALVDTPGSTAANWAISEANIGYVPENVANKDTDGTLAANSDTKYASQKATKTYADTKVPKVISGLSAAAAVADADLFPTDQGAGALKQTFAAVKTWIKAWIVKADVGLGNVDNTSDVNKPVSTAQATADALAIQNSLLTTRGDIITRSATAPQRVALGAAGTVVASDGTDTIFRTLTALLDAVFGNTQGQTLKRGASVWAADNIGASKASFSVNKNGTDQTGIASATPTQLTFGTEVWDVGNYFASNAWTPPAGKVSFTAQIRIVGTLTAGGDFDLYLYKNGVAYKIFRNVNSTTTENIGNLVLDDIANGTDVYTLFVQGTASSGTITAKGVDTYTWWQGKMIE